jgi:hypothetical protein
VTARHDQGDAGECQNVMMCHLPNRYQPGQRAVTHTAQNVARNHDTDR